MRLIYVPLLAALASLAFALPVTAAPLPTDVRVGSSAEEGEHPISARTTASVAWGRERPDGLFMDLGCSSASVLATSASVVRSGTDVVDPLVLDDPRFTGCTGPGGTLTWQAQTPWIVHRQGGTVTSGSADVVTGYVDGIDVRIGNLVCKHRTAGRAQMTFDEARQVLTIRERATQAQGLVNTEVLGCGGLIEEGGRTTLVMKLKITSPDGPINFVP